MCKPLEGRAKYAHNSLRAAENRELGASDFSS